MRAVLPKSIISKLLGFFNLVILDLDFTHQSLDFSYSAVSGLLGLETGRKNSHENL